MDRLHGIPTITHSEDADRTERGDGDTMPDMRQEGRMIITADMLKAKDACHEGVHAFSEVYPDGLDLALWTRDEQIRALRTPLGRYLGWGFEQGLIPFWSMSMADLSGANLYGANLTRANLYGANLTRADLSGANLYGANLYGANLYGANLYGANLYGANLTRANLTRADLTRADLSGADLSGADLSGADLSGANLTRAYRPRDGVDGWIADCYGYLQRAP